MYSNWKICQNDVGPLWQYEDIPNNCEKCGKLYRYNWRRRRTREKTCNLCANEVKCNVIVNVKKGKRDETDMMNYEHKTPEENSYIDNKTWDTPLSMFQYTDSSSESQPLGLESAKKTFRFQDLTDQLLHEMKIEFGEELRNPQKLPQTEFEWPLTNRLSKVDCLRAFNIMKQILLKEMAKELIVSDPLALRRKFYLERRFQSLEREKIRRLKVYESLYMQEEVKSGFEYFCKS